MDAPCRRELVRPIIEVIGATAIDGAQCSAGKP